MKYSSLSTRRFLAASAVVLFFSHRAMFGAEADATITQDDRLLSNVANLETGAQVVYVSSGLMAIAHRMIDEDAKTTFRFRPSDPHPTAVVRLAATQPIVRVSTILKTRAARLDVYLLNKLGNLRDLQDMKPIASVTDLPADRSVTVDLAAGGAGYLALRWTPEEGSNKSFEVAEIGAFSTAPVALLDLLPPTLADASSHLPAQSVGDFSNSLGTLADPPKISPVSP